MSGFLDIQKLERDYFPAVLLRKQESVKDPSQRTVLSNGIKG